MAFYQYKAVNRDGAIVRGMVEAADSASAYRASEAADLHIISVRKTNPRLAAIVNRIRAGRVRRRDIIEFSNNLAVMIRAGVPMLTALSDITETTENIYFLEKIQNLRNNVAMGSSFSRAVAMHGDIFPDIFIRLVTVGEETGNLEGSLRDVADHLQRVEDLASAIRSAMIYPAFALVSALGALIFWLVYVLPRVLSLFQDMNVPIPGITRLLISLSGSAETYWPLVIVVPAALFVFARAGRRNRRIAHALDLAKLHIPVVKLIVVNKILGIYAEQMRILIRAGLTVDRAFELVSEVIGNIVYQDALRESMDDVLSGATISEGLRNRRLFPAILVRMVHIGETSGTLEEQFAFLSEFYLKKLDDISRRLGKMIEPVIIIFLGVIFAVIILGLLMPIYDLVATMGRV